MSFLDLRFANPIARRTFLGAGGVALSGAAVALLSGQDALEPVAPGLSRTGGKHVGHATAFQFRGWYAEERKAVHALKNEV